MWVLAINYNLLQPNIYISDEGSIHASTILYKRNTAFTWKHLYSLLIICLGLLEAVLFAHIRFHDTISRGRLLNRFGKDFEGEKLLYMAQRP